MKIHSTNYFNTLIEIAEDSHVNVGEVPPTKGDKKSVANYQFEMLFENPYKYTSDDVFFSVFAIRKEIAKSELEKQRQQFFSKGQPCFRASPLTKRYGWGLHSNQDGRIAIYGAETEEYERFAKDESVKIVKAMRSKSV
ncbi:MAG: DUF6157 family protein [Melioribacteraceae bacterium]